MKTLFKMLPLLLATFAGTAQELFIHAGSEKTVPAGSNVALQAKGFVKGVNMAPKWQWEQVQGPKVDLFLGKTGELWFQAPSSINEKLRFKLTATSDNHSKTDYIDVYTSQASPFGCGGVLSSTYNSTKVTVPVKYQVNGAVIATDEVTISAGSTVTIDFKDCSVVPLKAVNTAIISDSGLVKAESKTVKAGLFESASTHRVSFNLNETKTSKTTLYLTLFFKNGHVKQEMVYFNVI